MVNRRRDVARRSARRALASMQTRRGIWNLENVDTKSLVDAKVYEGAFIWAPLKMIGATGSPGNPVVLY
jgi:kynurenine formamidase